MIDPLSRRVAIMKGFTALLAGNVVGFRNQIVPLFIAGDETIIDANGTRAYNGSPAAGNLVYSEATNGYSDIYGNVIPQGVTIYSQNNPIEGVNINGNRITWFGGSAGAAGFAQLNNTELQLGSPGANAADQALLNLVPASVSPTGKQVLWMPVANEYLVPSDPNNVGNIEPWHGVVFAAGFQDAGIGPSVGYQLEPINFGRVRLRGFVELNAAEPANTPMFTLPAAYRPSAVHYFLTPCTLNGNVLGSSTMFIDTSGNVSINVAGVNGNIVGLNGVVCDLA